MMAAKQMPPTPGGAGSGAEKNSAKSGQYSQAAAKASSKRWEWFKFWTDDWHVLVRGLKAEQRGVLVELLVLMHEDRGPVAEDCDWLATAAGTTRATIKKIIDRLVELGIIERKNGGLWSAYMQRQIEDQGERSEKNSRAAKKRFQKTKQNQRADDADAYRRREDVEDKEREGSKEPSPPPSVSEPVVENDPSVPVAESVDNPRRPPVREAQAGAAVVAQYLEQLDAAIDAGVFADLKAYHRRVDEIIVVLKVDAPDHLRRFVEQARLSSSLLLTDTNHRHEHEDDHGTPY